MWFAEQATPQPPQLFGSVVTLVSQPSAGLRLQSAKPWVPPQEVLHRPATHELTPFGDAHADPHAPQLCTSVATFTSQPLVAFPSQSAKPASQRLIAQAPFTHCEVAWARAQAPPQGAATH